MKLFSPWVKGFMAQLLSAAVVGCSVYSFVTWM